jgi:hypothetical protein
MRDDDARDRTVELVEHGGPALARIGQPEPRVHHGPAPVAACQQVAVDVVETERQRERDADEAAC